MTGIEALIIAASIQVGIPPRLMLATCWIESRLRNLVRLEDGRTPSYGPCQIKLGTARLFNKKLGARDLMNPKVSVFYAAKYLKHQISRYHGSIGCGLWGYNAGRARCRCNLYRTHGQLTGKKTRLQFDTLDSFMHTQYVDKVWSAYLTEPWEQNAKN